MGDFNSQPWSIPIALLQGYGGLRDSFLETHPSANDPPPSGLTAQSALDVLGMTCDSPLNTWSQGKPIPDNVLSAGGKRLDYIFYSTPALAAGAEREGTLRCRSSKVVLTEHIPGRAMSYSDHFGLTSTFTLAGPEVGGNPTPASQRPLLLESDTESTSSVIPPSGGSVYELARTESVDSTSGAIRAALTVLRAYGKLANKRTNIMVQALVACIVAVVGLTVGSAWQPKPWIQPIFTVLAFALGAGGATLLYTGWLWGRWEKGSVAETVAEMEGALRVIEEGGRR